MNDGILRVLLLSGFLLGTWSQAESVSVGGDFTVTGQVEARVASPSVGGDFAVTGTLAVGAVPASQGGDFAALASDDPSTVLLLPAAAGVPELRISLQDSDVLLSWPAGAGSWRVEVGNIVDSPSGWQEVGAKPIRVEGQLVLRVPVGPDPSFFRLRR